MGVEVEKENDSAETFCHVKILISIGKDSEFQMSLVTLHFRAEII